MALSAALVALPTVIESIKRIISSIDSLSREKKPKREDLATQNIDLRKALGVLQDSVVKIGIAIRDYQEIYSVALKEETAAKALTKQFSVWFKGLVGRKDTSISDGFKELRELDSELKKAVKANKDEIEKGDFEKINSLRSDIRESFNKAENHLAKFTVDSWKEAWDDINVIRNKLGEITSLLEARFKYMSKTLICIKT